jgi:hypothetical protein
MPIYGLSLHKPSTLWPPPSYEMTSRVHASLRSRIRHTFRMEDHHGRPKTPSSSEHESGDPSAIYDLPVDVGTTTNLPSLDSPNQVMTLTSKSGERLVIDKQVHCYAQNSLLIHPLVSPALSYLGGLPPLFFIASDKEVLRDEILYTCVRFKSIARQSD